MKLSKVKRQAKRKFVSVHNHSYGHGIFKLSPSIIKRKRINRNKRRNLKNKLCQK